MTRNEDARNEIARHVINLRPFILFMPAKSNVATSLVLKKKVEQERKSRQAAPERSNVSGQADSDF